MLSHSLLAVIIGIIISFPGKAQLSAVEKQSILNYCLINGRFVIYDPAVHNKMVNDPAFVHLLRPCVEKIRKAVIYHDLAGVDAEHLDYFFTVSGKISTAYRDKLLPNFNLKEFGHYFVSVGSLRNSGKDLPKLKGDHSLLMDKYAKRRKEKFTIENTLSVLDFEFPEEMTRVRAEIKNNFTDSKDATIEYILGLWLEDRYWNKLLDNANVQVRSDLTSTMKSLENCNNTIALLLEKSKPPDFKLDGDWVGTSTGMTSSASFKGGIGTVNWSHIFKNGKIDLVLTGWIGERRKGTWSEKDSEGATQKGNFEIESTPKGITIWFKATQPKISGFTYSFTR